MLFIALFLLGLFSTCNISYAKNVIATASRVVGDTNRTRFVTDVSRAVSYSVYVLPDPYRVVIDLPSVTFDLPPGSGQKVRGLVSEYRYGEVEAGKSRIILDTNGPVLIEKSYLVEAKNGQPARIVVDLMQISEEAFAASFAKDNPDALITKAEAAPPDEVPVPAAAPPPEEAAPELAALAPEPEPEPEPESAPAAEPSPAPSASARKRDGKMVIVLDPGHGGIDPGAVSGRKNKEKDVVLAFAHSLRKILEISGDYKVVMTRTDDSFISLKNRVKVARENTADLFIAIHADTVSGPEARGATLYTLSDEASDVEAAALAKKENEVDKIAGIHITEENNEISDILIDLAQRESKNHSVFFSKKAILELKSITHLTGKPFRSAGFAVLKSPDVPSVLLELGYLSSKEDEKLLISPVWRQKVANAMAIAVKKYFATEVASRAN